MTGLIPRADYDRLARRCEKLEEELAWFKGETLPKDDARVVLLVDRLGFRRKSALMVVALMAASPRLVQTDRLRLKMGSASVEAVKITASQLRTHIANIGGPSGAIPGRYGFGYRLTSEAVAWLSQRIPEAFPQPGGPTR